MPAGRPPFYAAPEELETAIESYFNAKKIWTIAGLAYHLGFAYRQALAELARDKPKFSSTITRARLRIEEQRSEALVDPEARNVNGMKFDLTNNFEWHDKTEQEHSGTISIAQQIQSAYGK